MKAALTLANGAGQWPNQAKAHQMGADRLGFETRDPRLLWRAGDGKSYLETLRANGWSLYAFRALWGYSGSPEGWAQLLRDDLASLDMLRTSQHGARQCALDCDLEVDDSAWMEACLRRVRQLLPGRGVTWSFQPHKGGVISDSLVRYINSDQWITVAPFAYRNDMQRCSERWVVDDLLARGILASKILVYYRDYCEGWDGFLWDLDQIT